MNTLKLSYPWNQDQHQSITDCTVIFTCKRKHIFYAQSWSTHTRAILPCKEVTVRCDSLSRLYASPQADKPLLGEGSPSTMPLYQFFQGTLRRRRHWVLARETQQNEDKNNSQIHASPAPCVIHISRRKHLTACTVVHYSLLIKPVTSFFKVERWHNCKNV